MKVHAKERKRLAELVGRFMHAMHRYDGGRMLPLMHRAELTLPQLAVLEFVEQARTVSAVAEHAGLSRPATSQMVDKLVKRGWVRRSEGATDRRERVVTLSGRGQALVEKVHAARAARFEGSLRELKGVAAGRLRRALEEALAGLSGGEKAKPGRKKTRGRRKP